MRYYTLAASILLFLIMAVPASNAAQNLLKNSGFEDAGGWNRNWIIRNQNGSSDTYHYRLDSHSGAHGDANPRSGSNALEIYSSDRLTYLVQKVHLEPGIYRLSAWARTNGTPYTGILELRLGDKQINLPVAGQKYRYIWTDFEIAESGDYEASFHSASYGVALDDLSLVKIDKDNIPPAPFMYIDLLPSNKDKAANIQNCLKGTPQWVEFGVTCILPGKINRPVMRILVPAPVKLSGLNEGQIHNYRMREEEQVRVGFNQVRRNGKQYQEFSFPLPRFIYGYDQPMRFGGFWVADVPSKGSHLIMEITDGEKQEQVLTSELIKLSLINPPNAFRTPKRYYILGYAVQNWMMDVQSRLAAIPYQYKMMGFNVWSDYGLAAEKPRDGLTNEEMVLKEAYDKYGFNQFWPNSSSMLDISGGMAYSDTSEMSTDKDMYVVSIDGKVNKNAYNFNYAANKGKAWMESAVAAWKRTTSRPIEMGLPFRYTGFINDGLEGMHQSYDASTLAAFAKYKGVDVDKFTTDKLTSEWKRDWLLFNMDLYKRVIDVWAKELQQVDPDIKIVNTAGTYGPGGFDSLTTKEQMRWASSVDYNMPQWYATHYFGSDYTKIIKSNDKAKIFGKANGGTDLIPLLNVSMGGDLEDPSAFRFRILDFLSASKSIKGIGYYIATYAFSDARFMVDLSAVHTLLADVEDYYADGVRDDSLVKVTMLQEKPLSTSVRVHKLNRGGRVALITVISYDMRNAVYDGVFACNKLAIDIDKSKLPNKGKGLLLHNRLTRKRSPLPSRIIVDTKSTENAALFEIVKGR